MFTSYATSADGLDCGYRSFYEAPLADGSHELRTELVRPQTS
jgi:hypothetical protein